MARPRTGSLIKRGKIGTYYLRYSLNGKVVQECLHTTIKSEAEIACDKIMYPLRKADEEAVLQQVELRIKNVHDKLEELEEGRTPRQKSKMPGSNLLIHTTARIQERGRFERIMRGRT